MSFKIETLCPDFFLNLKLGLDRHDSAKIGHRQGDDGFLKLFFFVTDAPA
jgi:hypothetical protein